MGILLLHGLGGDRTQVLQQLGPALPDHETVLAPDVRAHGASPLIGQPHDFSLDALAAEIENEAAAARLGPLTIVGVSMGAAIGLRIALRGRLQVERLVFVRPAFTNQPLPPNLAAFPVMGELLHRHPAEKAETLFKGTGAYRRLHLESRLGAAGALEQFRAPLAAERAIRLVEIPRNRVFDTPADLSELRMPSTVVAAPRDPVHPLSVAELWHAALPASTLTVLPARDDGVPPYLAAMRAAVSNAFA